MCNILPDDFFVSEFEAAGMVRVALSHVVRMQFTISEFAPGTVHRPDV